MNFKVLILLFLGSLALLISGIGGIIGGYVMYFLTKGKFNPVVGIAGVAAVRLVAPGMNCGGMHQAITISGYVLAWLGIIILACGSGERS